jgi:hypothetical protein
MNVKETDCPYVEEHDLIGRYLAGKLPERKAEAFEVHSLDCSRCWAEIQLAGEVRETLGQSFVQPASTRAAVADRKRDFWTPLAAAATVAVIILGWSHLASRTEPLPDSRVFRTSAVDSLDLTARVDRSRQVRLEWSSHPDARSYRIEILRSDGLSVWKRETPELSATVDTNSLPAQPTGVSLLARVEALDTMHQVLAASNLVPVP